MNITKIQKQVAELVMKNDEVKVLLAKFPLPSNFDVRTTDIGIEELERFGKGGRHFCVRVRETGRHTISEIDWIKEPHLTCVGFFIVRDDTISSFKLKRVTVGRVTNDRINRELEIQQKLGWTLSDRIFLSDHLSQCAVYDIGDSDFWTDPNDFEVYIDPHDIEVDMENNSFTFENLIGPISGNWSGDGHYSEDENGDLEIYDLELNREKD